MDWFTLLQFSGIKTYLAGFGLIGLAIYDASQGQWHDAVTHFTAGLAVIGIGHKLDKASNGDNGAITGPAAKKGN